MKLRKIAALVSGFALTALAGMTVSAKDVSDYQDVQRGDWFYSTVADISERELMTGMTDTVFAPAENLERGQLATIIYRMNGSPETAYEYRFPDVKDGQFYSSAITWAYDAGVIEGYEDGTFGPSDRITREQLATMLNRYAEKMGYDTTRMGNLEDYQDAGNVSEFAVNGMKWAVGARIIKGDGKRLDLLNPQGDVSRAVCATMISRMISYVESGGQIPEREQVQIDNIDFTRISRNELQITWSDQKNPYVREYIVKKRKNGNSEWITLGTLASDGVIDNRILSFTDVLESDAPQQFEYRIDIETANDAKYEAVLGQPAPASNLLLCLDPGHFAGETAVNEGGINYSEGDFILELAKELKYILKKSYGITAYMTRETGTVSIGGYTDAELDGGHISLRGEFAKGSDLFLSLHTNANLEGANGYGTSSQPVEITKPIIIANTIACRDSGALTIGNAIGVRLADTNYALGLGLPNKFKKINKPSEIISWTNEWNDGLDNPGAVCCRWNSRGTDYYGVLRGAANAGVPGFIIEHGFHTVPEMRRAAASEKLHIEWAKADAAGIAEGFGFREL